MGYLQNSTDTSDVRIRPKGKLKRISFVKEGSADHAADHKNKNEKDLSKDGNEVPELVYVQPTDKQSSWLKPRSRRSTQSAKRSVAKTSRRLKNNRQQTSRHPPSQREQTSRRLPKQKYFSKYDRLSAIKTADRPRSSNTLKTQNGKTIRIIQVWVPKGVINRGPN